MLVKDRLSITDVAKAVGVTPRTIMRWEKSAKIKKPKRDWRGWRFYYKEDIEEIKKFYESAYEYLEGAMVNVSNGSNGQVVNAVKAILIIAFAIASLFSYEFVLAEDASTAKEGEQTIGLKETPQSVDIVLEELPVVQPASGPVTDPITYTLGPDDVINIEVRRHPEFSGQYSVNSEGKIEYKYIGDVVVTDLTKIQLKERLTKILGEYLVEPEVDVQIVSYLSKVFYVVGEVGRPGKFYMRGNTIGVREALMQASLPTYAAAMRRCRLITPNKEGKEQYADVNVYGLLYEGDLKEDLAMKPGDVLYVPATVLAKIIRVISPIRDTASETVGTAASTAAVAGAAL